MPRLGPELCHDRGLACLAFPRPWDCVGVTVALGVTSVMVSGLACGSGTRESTPVADIAVNRHQSSISSLKSYSTSKYPQLLSEYPARATTRIRLQVVQL